MIKFASRDIEFFFDSKAKDSFDQGVLSARQARMMRAREKMMRLADHDFEHVMTSMESILSSVEVPLTPEEQKAQRKKNSKALFEKVKS